MHADLPPPTLKESQSHFRLQDEKKPTFKHQKEKSE